MFIFNQPLCLLISPTVKEGGASGNELPLLYILQVIALLSTVEADLTFTDCTEPKEQRLNSG